MNNTDFNLRLVNANPISTNVTVNGIVRSGLRQGDYIRVNQCTHSKIISITGDMLLVETLKGTVMNISSDNVIDIIC